MKQVFLYIGVDNAFTRGGVGVHTRGTVEGVIDQQQFDEHWVLWPCAQQTYFYDEALQQTGVNLNYSAVINSQSFYHSLSYRLWCRLKVLASALKIGLKLSKYHKVTIYTRYSPWLTPLLIMFMHNKAYCVVESNYQDRNELDYTRPTLRKAPKKWLKTTRLYRRLFYLGEKYSCRRTALNLGINHEITQRLQNYGATQTDVSPCATSSQLIKTAESLRQQTARQRHNLNESNLILGYVGAVKASFHLDKLLVAMTYANYRSELKLLIASQMSDGYADTLAQFIGDLGMADQVIWRRPENREQCVEFIVASNVIPILRPYMGIV